MNPRPKPTVYLKPPDAADQDRFLRAVRQSTALHRSMVSPPRDAESFQNYLELAKLENREAFLICRKSDGVLVGAININEIVRFSFQSGYLGYFALVPHQRKGYMTEGLALVVKHAFTVLKLHRLEANIQPENTPSIALVKRFGFKKEGFSPRYLKVRGRWQDHERWALTKEDWRVTKNGATAIGG